MMEPGRHEHGAMFKYFVVPAEMMIHNHITKTTFETVCIICTKLNFRITIHEAIKFPLYGRDTYSVLYMYNTTVSDFLQKDSKIRINVYHHLTSQ